MEPWGTQKIKLDILENLAPIWTLWVLEVRKEELQRSADAEIVSCISMIKNKIVWSTQSIAALKLRRRRIVMNPRSKASPISLYTFRTAISVKCNQWFQKALIETTSSTALQEITMECLNTGLHQALVFAEWCCYCYKHFVFVGLKAELLPPADPTLKNNFPIQWPYHWRRLVKNIGGENQNIEGKPKY